MGTVILEKNQVWIRCFDGTEMEYEVFDLADTIEKLSSMDNHAFASSVGAVHDNELERTLNKLRDGDI